MFTKNDLQNGDFVVLRNGMVHQVIIDTIEGNIIVSDTTEWNNLSYFENDMTSSNYKSFDIINVYRPQMGYQFRFNQYKEGKLIYERKEKTEKEIEMEKLQEKINELQEQYNKLKNCI